MASPLNEDTEFTFSLSPHPRPRLPRAFGSRRSFPLLALSASVGLFVFAWIYFLFTLYAPSHPNHLNHPHRSGLDIKHITHSPFFRRTVFQYPNYSILKPKDHTLILTITNDTSSWGSLSITSDVIFTFEDFISRIQSQRLPVECLHLGLLTSDLQAYNHYVSVLSSLISVKRTPWAKAEIIYLAELPGQHHRSQVNGEELRGNKHMREDRFQIERKRYMARLRNFLSSHMLTPEVEHVIWLDADVYELPPGLFQRFLDLGRIQPNENIDHMVKAGLRYGQNAEIQDGGDSDTLREIESINKAAPPIGLITLRCQSFGHWDYDRNAWSGFGERPSSWELNNLLRGTEYPGMENWAKALSQIINGTEDHELVKLDSVGGTALYIRAELLREGLVFPVYSTISTEWGKEGVDGIEAEGLCYIAERLGWGCYALGGTWRTLHTDA